MPNFIGLLFAAAAVLMFSLAFRHFWQGVQHFTGCKARSVVLGLDEISKGCLEAMFMWLGFLVAHKLLWGLGFVMLWYGVAALICFMGAFVLARYAEYLDGRRLEGG